MLKKLFVITVVALIPSSVFAFTDVPTTHENSTAILYIQNEGIVEGYVDNTFRPENTINRAEFTKIIVEATWRNSDVVSDCAQKQQFSDVAAGKWYDKYICVAAKTSLVSGYPDGTFKPGNHIIFSEAAKIIAAADSINFATGRQELPELVSEIWYERYVRYLEDRNAIPLSITSFDTEITRGEMAEIIYRLKVGDMTKPSQSYATLLSTVQRGDVHDENDMFFLLSKLKDPNYTDTYNEGYTWYIAAEELGMIGKPAIPFLIEKLHTRDDYERTQTLYALLLASQKENVRAFTGGEYVKGNGMALPRPEDHPDIIHDWKVWFEKYKDNF